MLEMSVNSNNIRNKDDMVSKTNRSDVSKKRQKNNVDPDGNTVSLSKTHSIYYEDLQNRMTSIQVARHGIENSLSILNEMRDMVYSDKENVEFFNKKKFDTLKSELEKEKLQVEDSIKELRGSKESKALHKILNEKESRVEQKKKSHFDFIQSLKTVPELENLHKGLTADRVAALLS